MDEESFQNAQDRVDELKERLGKVKEHLEQKSEKTSDASGAAWLFDSLDAMVEGLGHFVNQAQKGAGKLNNLKQRFHQEVSEGSAGSRKRPGNIPPRGGRPTGKEPTSSVSRPQRDRPDQTVDDPSETFVDLHEEGEEVSVYLECPGASEEEVSVDRGDSGIIIDVQSSDREYKKEVDMPKSFGSLRDVELNNGILRLVFSSTET